MQIAVINREFSLGKNEPVQGTKLAALITELQNLGHTVIAVAPCSPELDPDTHSLARRLAPLRFNSQGRDISCTRYDGRIPMGVDVHLLELRESADGKLIDEKDHSFCQVFRQAAEELIKTFTAAPDWCLSFDCGPIGTGRKGGQSIGQMVVISNVEDCQTDGADIVVVSDSCLAERIVREGIQPLASMLASGAAVSIPSPPQTIPLVGDKASAKATFQMRVGLPVLDRVPLVFFADVANDPFEEVLASFLLGDVQVIAREAGHYLNALQERFSDRLTIVDAATPIEDILKVADGCVAGRDSSLCHLAMMSGTVPLTTSDLAGGIVDLEPSLQSGSGIVVQQEAAQGINEGLGRLVTAFKRGPEFRALADRLPNYINTWQKAARQYTQLMEEIR